MTFREVLEVQELNPEYVLVQQNKWSKMNINDLVRDLKARVIRTLDSKRDWENQAHVTSWLNRRSDYRRTPKDVSEEDIMDEFVLDSLIAVTHNEVYIYTDDDQHTQLMSVPRELFTM